MDTITEYLARDLALGFLPDLLKTRDLDARQRMLGYSRAAAVALNIRWDGALLIFCQQAARHCGPYPHETLDDAERRGWETMYVETVVERLEGLVSSRR